MIFEQLVPKSKLCSKRNRLIGLPGWLNKPDIAAQGHLADQWCLDLACIRIVLIRQIVP